VSRRLLPLFPLGGIVLLALVHLCAAGSAAARHRSQGGEGVPGDFAYYLLSLSWSPAFCLASPDAAECSGPRRYGFILHGLWPQYERGWPEHCDVRRRVPDEVVLEMAGVMPARSLVYHEWLTHGTCSGLEPDEYFALARRAFANVSIPPELSNPAQAIERPKAAILSAFLRANPRFPPESIMITCSGQDAARLREVHLCLDRNLTPRACSTDALRGACRAFEVIIPPVR
jgi:ribonuclease T2